MKDDSRLAALLRDEAKSLNEQRAQLDARIAAIDLLLGEALLETAADLDAGIVPPPKVKRGRRTNAQIAADKAAAAKVEADSTGALTIAVITDEDEKADEAVQ